ncbi:MAG: hypothetical protein SGCHY_003509 [Lobulomycetales sp.]
MLVFCTSIPGLSTQWPTLQGERTCSLESVDYCQPHEAVILTAVALADVKTVLDSGQWKALCSTLATLGFPAIAPGNAVFPSAARPVLNLHTTSTLQLAAPGGAIGKLFSLYNLQEDILAISEFALGSGRRLHSLQCIAENTLHLRLLSQMISQADRLSKEASKWKARSTVLAQSIAADLERPTMEKIVAQVNLELQLERETAAREQAELELNQSLARQHELEEKIAAAANKANPAVYNSPKKRLDLTLKAVKEKRDSVASNATLPSPKPSPLGSPLPSSTSPISYSPMESEAALQPYSPMESEAQLPNSSSSLSNTASSPPSLKLTPGSPHLSRKKNKRKNRRSFSQPNLAVPAAFGSNRPTSQIADFASFIDDSLSGKSFPTRHTSFPHSLPAGANASQSPHYPSQHPAKLLSLPVAHQPFAKLVSLHQPSAKHVSLPVAHADRPSDSLVPEIRRRKQTPVSPLHRVDSDASSSGTSSSGSSDTDSDDEASVVSYASRRIPGKTRLAGAEAARRNSDPSAGTGKVKGKSGWSWFKDSRLEG